MVPLLLYMDMISDQDMLLDLSLHATPSVVLLADLLLLSPPWTIKPIPALSLSGALAVAYWFWVELCFAHNGWWVDMLREEG